MLRIALGGALGTGLRLLAAGGMAAGGAMSVAPPGPVRLLVLNVAGAGLLGWVMARRPLPERWMPAVITGFLGGLTTFSTMIVQAGALGHDAGLVDAASARMTGAGLSLVAAYLIASVTLGIAALTIGRSVGARRRS